MNLIVVSFLACGLTCAQDFGKVYNRSSIIVNFIDEHDAKLYDNRKYLVLLHT